MDKLLRKAMAERGVKNARQLHQLVNGKVSYQVICTALNGAETKLSNLVVLFDAIGFELTYKTK